MLNASVKVAVFSAARLWTPMLMIVITLCFFIGGYGLYLDFFSFGTDAEPAGGVSGRVSLPEVYHGKFEAVYYCPRISAWVFF